MLALNGILLLLSCVPSCLLTIEPSEPTSEEISGASVEHQHEEPRSSLLWPASTGSATSDLTKRRPSSYKRSIAQTWAQHAGLGPPGIRETRRNRGEATRVTKLTPVNLKTFQNMN